MYRAFLDNITEMDNLLLLTDSYKITHHYQYPPNTELVYSYFESRGGEFSHCLFFGLQYLLKKWLVGEVVTLEKIEEAKAILQVHFGNDYFNESGWKYIVEKHKGRLPIRIRSVPEGSIIPVKNVLFTVENTDPKCYWLTNYLETLLVQCWYPMTVATISMHMKCILRCYRDLTTTTNHGSSNEEALLFQLHDFGCRGATCMEAAALGGAGHLVNFRGSDTLPGLLLLRRYYSAVLMPGFSIPATEHSTVTTWGRDGETDAFQNLLDSFPRGNVACVSDSYNVWEAVKDLWGDKFKAQIQSREGGALVIRPDSGEPCEIVPKLLEILAEKFGAEINDNGYRVLPSYIRLIQGDGIDVHTLDGICRAVMDAGFSLENVTFGCGGGLLQKHNRDTLKCAYKCSFAVVDSNMRDVYKEPITDIGKKSKRGRLQLVKEESSGSYSTLEQTNSQPNDKDCLQLVYENGVLLRDWTLDEIRLLASQYQVIS